MKEQILKEFRKEYVNKNGIYRHEPKILEQFLSQAIDQTREETIREVEEKLPKEEKTYKNNNEHKFVNTWNEYRQEILDILNKLKK